MLAQAPCIRMLCVRLPRLDAWPALLDSDAAIGQLAFEVAQLITDALDAAFAQQAMRRVDAIPQKIQRAARLANREYLGLAVSGQAQGTPQELLDARPPRLQLRLVVMQHHKIIHVADVVPDAEIVLCVAIQLVEIEIGKQLTCQVAERDPDTRPPWARVDNGIEQPERAIAVDLAAQDRLEAGVIDAGEILADVRLQAE